MTRTLNTSSKKALEDRVQDARSAEFDYVYPDVLEGGLKPFEGPENPHDFILEEIKIRARESHTYMQQFFPQWAKLDQNVSAFVPSDAAEKRVVAKDSRKPVSIVIPQSYAILETLTTFGLNVMLRDPIHQFGGVGPEDTAGAMLLEQNIRLQSRRFKEDLSLYVQNRSSFLHGVGVAVSSWDTIRGMRAQTEVVDSVMAELFGLNAREGDVIRDFQEQTIFEGTRWDNIDSYDYLPDPKMAPHHIQKGEFVGWKYRTDIQDLLTKESDPKNRIVNVKYLRLIKGAKLSATLGNDNDGRLDFAGGSPKVGNEDDQVDVIEMYIRIIPREWGLGDGILPEMWMFAIAGDLVVIRAEKAHFAHGQYPVTIMAPNMDGYEAIPVSNIAVTFGLQRFGDWMASSHVANVRKAINTMLIVDPSAVELEDLRNPNPAKFIRLKRSFYGAGKIDQWVKQLAVSDVTGNHMAEVAGLIEMMKSTSGATGLVEGDLKGLPDRPTESGLAAARDLGLSKLQKMARISSSTALYDAAWQMGFNTQQFMDQDTYIDIAGRHAEELKAIFEGELGNRGTKIPISPRDISIAFDIDIGDGTSPQQAPVQFWNQQVQALLANEVTATEIMTRLDPVRVYLLAARLNGAENARDLFRSNQAAPQTQVLPDEEVQAQVQAGNLIGV